MIPPFKIFQIFTLKAVIFIPDFTWTIKYSLSRENTSTILYLHQVAYCRIEENVFQNIKLRLFSCSYDHHGFDFFKKRKLLSTLNNQKQQMLYFKCEFLCKKIQSQKMNFRNEENKSLLFFPFKSFSNA